jgi:hypothetical protein
MNIQDGETGALWASRFVARQSQSAAGMLLPRASPLAQIAASAILAYL